MTTMTADRFRRYTRDEVRRIMAEQGYSIDDLTYLTSVSNYAMVSEMPSHNPKEMNSYAAWMRSVDVAVLEISDYATGIYQEAGQAPMILLNTETAVMDYDFVSELHPQHDWDVYLWVMFPYTISDMPLVVMAEWFRRDVYPDNMSKYTEGELGWEDRREDSEEDDD